MQNFLVQAARPGNLPAILARQITLTFDHLNLSSHSLIQKEKEKKEKNEKNEKVAKTKRRMTRGIQEKRKFENFLRRGLHNHTQGPARGTINKTTARTKRRKTPLPIQQKCTSCTTTQHHLPKKPCAHYNVWAKDDVNRCNTVVKTVVNRQKCRLEKKKS
jgi:hypothetical protein